MLNRHLEKAVSFAKQKVADRSTETAEQAAREQIAKLRAAAREGAEPILKVGNYDRAEHEASLGLSIPHLMAFKPVSYQLVGWPHRITDTRELARYADHNFEAEIAGLFEPGAHFDPVGYRNAFTYDEMELVGGVRETVRNFTAKWFGRRVAPVSNILVQVGPFRMVDQIKSAFGLSEVSLFEAGPGAGYLGAFLATSGQRYTSFDVAQSYYLWQSCLMQATGGEDFAEIAGLDEPTAKLAAAESRVVHLPWWRFVNFLTGPAPRADIVYSNSNLAEMSRVSLRMLLHVSKTILSDSEAGVFTFFSKGMPAQTPHEQIDEEFKIFGYHKVFEEPFHAYVLDPDKAEVIAKAFENGILDYDPSGRAGSLSAQKVTPLTPDEAPLDTQLTQWYHGWQPPFSD
ncbi:MAG: hypothetical protein AAGF59_02240 [Pseudomonadota bacterium]